MMIKVFENFNEPEVKEEFWDNGQKKYEQWLLNGVTHREDGPAHQWWYSNGQIWSKTWCLNGFRYSREDWVDELKKIGSKHYEEQLLLFNMKKYNI